MTINVFGGGNTGGPAFPVQRSVRLRSSASAYFNRTLTTPTNNKIWTWSAWVKRGKASGTSAAALHLFGTGSGSADAGTTQIYFDNENLVLGGYSTVWLKSNAVYRDPSSWYHIVVAWDNSNATATNRAKIYFNGVEITYVTDNRASLSTTSTYGINQAVLHTIGAWSWNNGTFAQPEYYDGYLTEVNFIDGQALTPTSFGSINSSTGVWQPIKYSGTYGTNGFYLNFNDNSAATAAAIGKDSSGNGNNWTPNNISVTAGVTYDSMLDVPTNTSANNANFAVLNTLDKSFSSSTAILNGNLRFSDSTSSTGADTVSSTMFVSTGKWYWEATITAVGSTAVARVGITKVPVYNQGISNGLGAVNGQLSYQPNGNKQVDGAAASAYGASYTTGDVIGIALDCDGGTITFYKNNSSQGAITYSSGSGAAPAFGGVDTYGAIIDVNFGQRPFTYTPPSGFKSLNTYNLPAPTIPNGAAQFAATTYTGVGSSLAISNTVNGKSFQPDLVWVKGRSGATDHALYDSVRGTTKQLESNTTTAETTEATGLTAFDTGGFTVGALAQMNTNTATYVGWQWKASNAAPVTNTSGSITSSVSANPSAGFSIVTYTGTGANATVGHGLGVAPKMIIIKQRSAAGNNWVVYNSNLTSNAYYLTLNTTNAQSNAVNFWNNTSPTSSVFSIGSVADNNASSATYVAYCFSEIAGYSKFGSYTGNGSTDGPFVYTGFRPRWIMAKVSNGTTGDWQIFDTSRNTYNAMNLRLDANASTGESTVATFDYLSNGFKLRVNSAAINGSGYTFIYAAFAESPFQYSLAR